MKTIRDMNVVNKRVILRLDLNVPLKDGQIVDDFRIKASLETINYLINNQAKVIILSHLGRIKSNEDKKKYSLEIVASRLKELLGKEVYFSKDNFSNDLINRVNMMQNGEVLVLENTRFLDYPNKLESSCDAQLSLFWSSLGDIFCNDAFACSHRKHASTYGISLYLPSCIGFLMERELNNLDRLVINAIHPFTVIMGGAKIDDKIDLFSSILSKCEYLLCGGGIANTCLYVLGFNVGDSIHSHNPEILNRVKELLYKYRSKIMVPLDVIVGSSYDKNYIKYKTINEIDSDDVILDVGVKTLQKYNKAISTSQTIFINGTVGKYEDIRYANGTKELLKLISQTDAVTVVGGGDAASSVNNFGYHDKMTYISSGGGATLDYLSYGKLVALEKIMEGDSIETLDI